MIVMYNCLAKSDVIILNVKPLTEADYYARMKKHGIGISFCLWIMPGTIKD